MIGHIGEHVRDHHAWFRAVVKFNMLGQEVWPNPPKVVRPPKSEAERALDALEKIERPKKRRCGGVQSYVGVGGVVAPGCITLYIIRFIT